MGKVVIMDCDEFQLHLFQQMLEQYIETYDIVFASEPEELIALLETKQVSILICELDMPVLSGKELFSMCSLISPLTVKVAMTRVDDISEILQFVNECNIFKLLLKPVHFSEDIISVIENALRYHAILQMDLELDQEMKVEIDLLQEEQREDQDESQLDSMVTVYDKSMATIQQKEKLFQQLREVVLQIVEQDFKYDPKTMQPETMQPETVLFNYMDEVMNLYLECFCCSVISQEEFQKRMEEQYTISPTKKISKVSVMIESCSKKDFSKLSFACFVFANLCLILLEEYQLKIKFEEKDEQLMVKFLCSDWKIGNVPEKISNLLFSFTNKVFNMLYSQAVIGYEDNPFIAIVSMNREVEE